MWNEKRNVLMSVSKVKFVILSHQVYTAQGTDTIVNQDIFATVHLHRRVGIDGGIIHLVVGYRCVRLWVEELIQVDDH
jgi:hypothetical protein